MVLPHNPSGTIKAIQNDEHANTAHVAERMTWFGLLLGNYLTSLSPIGEMIIDNISGNRWLVSALEKGQLSIQKLRALFNITTESFAQRRKQERGLILI